MTTVKEVVNEVIRIADNFEGVDQDGVWGTQCVDLPNYLSVKYFGKTLWGNAIDLLNSATEAGYEVIYDAPGVNPKTGDIFVMDVPGSPYGHTGFVREDSDGYTIKTIEQNIDGYRDDNYDGIDDAFQVGGIARYNERDFSGIVGWFRFPYDGLESEHNKHGIMTEIVKTKDKQLWIRITHEGSKSMTPGTEFSVYAVNEHSNSCVGCEVNYVEDDVYNVMVPFDKFNDGEYKLYVEIKVDDNHIPREIAWYPYSNAEVDYGKGKLMVKEHRAYLVRNKDVEQVATTQVAEFELDGVIYKIMK